MDQIDPIVVDITAWFEQEAVRKAYIGIDTPAQTPVIGGLRILDYTEESADPLDEVRNLARAMTHKTQAAGVDLGGGKAVIDADIGEDVAEIKTERMLRRFGRAVDSQDGRYITAEDMNTTTADMDIVAEETDHVVGLSEGNGGLGDPSPITAEGVIQGMQAALRHQHGDGSLEDRTIVVQGAGKVGAPLIAQLIESGATVKVAELDDDRIEALRSDLSNPAFEEIDPDTALQQEADILAPCATSEVISPEIADDLGCDIIAGSANEILIDEQQSAQTLAEAGILYAPDFVINAGGLLAVIEERRDDGSHSRARERTKNIADRLKDIFATADREDITTPEAAKRIARRRITV